MLGLACSLAVRPSQPPLVWHGVCCIFASPRAILKTFASVSARTRMQSVIITITFLLLLLLSRFPFATEYLCLRLFFPRYILLNFSRLHVICHRSVGNSALKSPLITEAINSGYHITKVRDEKCCQVMEPLPPVLLLPGWSWLSPPDSVLCRRGALVVSLDGSRWTQLGVCACRQIRFSFMSMGHQKRKIQRTGGMTPPL